MDFIKSTAVNAGIESGSEVSLDQYIRNGESVPISMFPAASVGSSIEKAIAYLNDKRCGSVHVPADVNNKSVIIRAAVSKTNQVVINYITSNYRFPINSESRPYNGGNWKVGDIVLNNDYSDSQCYGWICATDGTPGVWLPFAYMKRWYTEIEKVSELPEPSAMQEGRQLICKNETGLTFLYYCAQTSDDPITYKWVKQNVFDSDIEDKIDEIFTPKWDALIANLNENLADTIGPAIGVYFSNNPIPIIQTSNVAADGNNWKVTALKDGTTYDKLPDKFILIMPLPSKSSQETKINLLGTVFSVKSYSNADISEGELENGVLAQFTVDKTNKVAFYSSGSRVADNSCYINVTVTLQSSSSTPDPSLLEGLEIRATGSDGTIHKSYTNASGSCLLELPVDDYSVNVTDITNYSSAGAVSLLGSALKGKTTIVPLTMNYNKGRMVVQVNFTNNTDKVAAANITGTKVTIKKGTEVVSEGYLTAKSGVGTAAAVGEYAPTTLFDAANSDSYTVQITQPSGYQMNTSSKTVNGASIRDAIYTVSGFTASYLLGDLTVNLVNSYTSATLSNVKVTMRTYDSSGTLTNTTTFNATTGTPVVRSNLDGRYKYVLTVEAADWPAGFEIDAAVTVAVNALLDKNVSINLSMIKRRQTLHAFIIDTSNSDPAGCVTYAESSVGKIAGSVAWMNEWPFNQVQPALVRVSDKKVFKLNKTNVQQYENGTSAASDIASTNYNAVVILPKLWYKFEWITSTQLKVSISDVEATGFNRFPKNTNFDYACKGMFEGYATGNKLYSSSGKTCTASQTIGTFRTWAAAHGAGYCQNTFEIQKVLEILFVLYYKNLNSQTALGNGNSSSSAYLQTGSLLTKNTGSLAHHAYGTTANTTEGVKFLWIENFWADYWEFVDGILLQDRVTYLQYDITKFADAIAGYTNTGKANCTTSGYVSKVHGDNECGFLPTEVAGSTTTYFSDYYWQNTGLRIAQFGGHRSYVAYYGAFCWSLNGGPSSAYALIVARLCVYLTEAQFAAAS